MNDSTIYIFIALGVIVILAIVALVLRRKGMSRKMSRLTAVSIALILISMAFEDRRIAYSLMGIAVILAVIDIVRKYPNSMSTS